jgi:hypothetical protein
MYKYIVIQKSQKDTFMVITSDSIHVYYANKILWSPVLDVASAKQNTIDLTVKCEIKKTYKAAEASMYCAAQRG